METKNEITNESELILLIDISINIMLSLKKDLSSKELSFELIRCNNKIGSLILKNIFGKEKITSLMNNKYKALRVGENIIRKNN